MVTNLKQLCGGRYKIVDDGTHDGNRAERMWCQEIQGRYGAIYPHGWDGSLAVRVDRPRAVRKVRALGYPVASDGEAEVVFVFPPSDIDRVARLIRARRRRRLSPEQRARQAGILACARDELARRKSGPVSPCLGSGCGP